MSPCRVIIVAGGDLKDTAFYHRLLKKDDYFICVNGGTAHAFKLGLKPDMVIGDLDSLQPGDRKKLEQTACRLIEYPQAKEKSDLELAVDKAVEMGPREILVVGALGGARADHFFVNLLLLNIPLNLGITASIIDEYQEIRLVKDEVVIEGSPGDYLSLFALTGEAEGIVTEGLKFPLNDESLLFASTRGLSNELIATRARVTLQSGLLLMIKSKRHWHPLN